MIDFHAVVKTKQKTYRDPVYPLPSFLQQPGSINTNIVHISLITKIPHAALLKPQPLLTDPQPSHVTHGSHQSVLQFNSVSLFQEYHINGIL